MSTCLLVKVEMSHTLSSKLKHDADPCRCVVKCDVVQFTHVILDCSEPVLKHSRGIRQTPHAP